MRSPVGFRAMVVALAMLVAACAPAATSQTPATRVPTSGVPATASPDARPVIVDTDMAGDDWLAILLLLGRPDVKVVAITVTGTGEAHCDPGVRNALALVALAGEPDIPVACGREAPLAGEHAFPDAWRDRVDELFGIDIPDGSGTPKAGNAVDLLVSIVDGSPEPVTLLTLGPLTNVAEALERSPSFAQGFEAVYVMGGAVDVAGNVGPSIGIDNAFAEWNVYVDPLAAQRVVEGMSTVLVPLDATNHAPATRAFVDGLVAGAATDEARFAGEVLTALGPSIDGGGYFFWDPLAAAILIDARLTTFVSSPLTVVADEGPTSGRVVRADAGPTSMYAISADVAAFEAMFLQALNSPAR